jgi:hypothetical protein
MQKNPPCDCGHPSDVKEVADLVDRFSITKKNK